MNRIKTESPSSVRSGYTLVEVMVVTGLTSLIVLMASSAWRGFGRTSADVIARCRVSQEARLAVETLQCDLGGNLLGSTLGQQRFGKLVGRLIVGGSQLLLCFDGGSANGVADWAKPDTVISYELEDDRLLRVNQQTGSVIVVACHIEGLRFTDNGDGVTINLALQHQNHKRNYSFISKDP